MKLAIWLARLSRALSAAAAVVVAEKAKEEEEEEEEERALGARFWLRASSKVHCCERRLGNKLWSTKSESEAEKSLVCVSARRFHAPTTRTSRRQRRRAPALNGIPRKPLGSNSFASELEAPPAERELSFGRRRRRLLVAPTGLSPRAQAHNCSREARRGTTTGWRAPI